MWCLQKIQRSLCSQDISFWSIHLAMHLVRPVREMFIPISDNLGILCSGIKEFST